jgi:Peptidase family S41/Tricorn protease C1 domain
MTHFNEMTRSTNHIHEKLFHAPLRKAGTLGLMMLTLGVWMARADINLLQRYSTQLEAGDTAPERARPWQFAAGDIFQLTGFTIEMAHNLHVQTGAADLGIGHCADGAVWALVLPRANGKLSSPATNNEEGIAHVWLRFHPALLGILFPPQSVIGFGQTNLLPMMRAIAAHKFRSAFHAGENALIPNPNDVIVDVDTPERLRRFFVVDRAKQTAAYAAAFEHQSFKPHPALTPALAEETFDQLWDAFDSTYAMFIIRPEVDWDRSREQWRPKALACQTSDDFAAACAEMLKPLRDLHVSLSLAGTDIPVFDRPRPANSNPPAHKGILGDLHIAGRLQWAVTSDKIGFAGIYGWDDASLPEQFDKALEQMRHTKGLIVDVRWNGGGNERLAQQVAGRFLQKTVVYAYDQFRDGPERTNLTKRFPRSTGPDGPWRYEKPVILLIGQKCMSSGESFVGMMMGATNVTTMGDHTCGSSGNPQVLELPLDMTVGVPRWIDFLPDGKPLDEHGFRPQIPFTPSPDGMSGNRDDLLSAALEHLRHAPEGK